MTSIFFTHTKRYKGSDCRRPKPKGIGNRVLTGLCHLYPSFRKEWWCCYIFIRLTLSVSQSLLGPSHNPVVSLGTRLQNTDSEVTLFKTSVLLCT